MPATIGDLGKALAAVNVAAERINLSRKYDITPGSRTNGTSYTLHEFNPSFTHSTDTRIGFTRTEAYRYLQAMEFAFGRVFDVLLHRAAAEVRPLGGVF